jgi:hypothetical protein
MIQRLSHGNSIVTEPITGGGYIAFYDDSRRLVFGWGLYRDAAVNDLIAKTKPGVLQSSEVEHGVGCTQRPASAEQRHARERPSQDLNDSESSAPK